MRTYLALDLGTKRIGVATASEPTRFPSPWGSIEASGKEAEKQLIKLILELDPSVVVVGLPLNEDNTENLQSAKVRKIVERIKKRIKVEIIFIDEYSTSIDAVDLLKFKPRKIRDSQVDPVAAVLILKAYLESIDNK